MSEGASDAAPCPVAVIGLGAIGGALALALLTDRRFALSGLTADASDAAAAQAAGVHVCADLAEAVRLVRGGIVVIATPLDEIARIARAALDIDDTLLLTHTGSLQRPSALGLEGRVAERTVGAHPVAGTESSGFRAARADLFGGATVSIESRAGAAARARITELWQAAGATTIEIRDAEVHDDLMAWASHLPQLVATALAATIADAGVRPRDVGSGARDTTRLARSTLTVWRPILERAPDETRRALGAARAMLESLERALERGDHEALEQHWEQAQRWRAAAERA